MSSLLKLIGTVVVVVGVGLLIGWLATRGPTVPPPGETSAPSASLPAPEPGRTPDPARTAPAPSPQASMPPPVVDPSIPVPAPASLPVTQTITNWEDKVDEILGAEANESVKAMQMLSIFPQLPEDGQVEVAQHLSNLLDDQNYSPLSQYLTNSATSEPVLDVLIADLLNRPNGVKLPLLLEVARIEQHPKSIEAHEILELFLEEDYGKDWNRWQSRMQQWLQENPD